MLQDLDKNARRALIALIVMGIVIIAGFVWVGIEIARRTSSIAADFTANLITEEVAEEQVAQSTVNAPFLAELPSGTRIRSIAPVNGLLAIHTDNAQGYDRIYIIRPETGEIIGNIGVAPQGAD